MLVAHKIVDAIKSAAPNRLDLTHYYSDGKHLARVVQAIEAADKFEFCSVPFVFHEPEDKDKPAYADLPTLTQDEHLMFTSGLIPFPAPLCYFEFQLQKRTKCALLIEQHKDNPLRFAIERLNFWEGQQVIVNGCTAEFILLADGSGAQSTFINEPEDKANSVSVRTDLHSCMTLAIYFCLMLLSRTTAIENQLTPPKLRKAQLHRGQTPLPDHRTVTIVPNHFTSGGRTAYDSSEGRHVRLHWRRSHIRHYDRATPNNQFVSRCSCCGRTDLYVQTIARYIAGARELGEITHDYFVR